MKSIFFAVCPLLLLLTSCGDDDNTVTQNPSEGYEGYTLVWSDEFETSISNLNWTYELGDGTDYGLPPGWGNAELQLYTNDAANAFIENTADINALVLQANEDSDGSYSSAKLTTQGLQSFRYGRIEARMKLPQGQGIWPAFWMLGENITELDWPGCGEIDIMELIGSEPNIIHSTAHYTSSENKLNSIMGSTDLTSGNFSDDFHLFRLDWTPDEMIFSVDGAVHHSIPIAEDMKEFNRPMYLIFNIAVGGNWPGNPDATTVFPQKMMIDWVRYYSKDGLNAAAAPALDINEETIGTITPPDGAQYAFNSSLTQFPSIGLKAFGGGGEPVITVTDEAIEGDSALLFSYPGGSWGGGWFEMETPMDLSAFANGNLVFSIRHSADLADAEIKLEAVSNAASVFLINYTPMSATNDYVTYTIPMADFTDLDFSAIKIPFAMWNPVDGAGEYPVVDVLLDDIYWEE